MTGATGKQPVIADSSGTVRKDIDIDGSLVKVSDANKNWAGEMDIEQDLHLEDLFRRIRYCTSTLGIRFNHRSKSMRTLSLVIVVFNCCLFLSYWQHTKQASQYVKLIFRANKGLGIRGNQRYLTMIVNMLYVVIAIFIFFYLILIIANLMGLDPYSDTEIPLMLGDRRLFLILQLSSLHCKLCWGVALFLYCLLVHSTNFECAHFNDQLAAIEFRGSYEKLCSQILELMEIRVRLTECVQRLDGMFSLYAFVMFVTIIPSTIFTSFMFYRGLNERLNVNFLFSPSRIIFCLLSFAALVNAPMRLHKTIYSAKPALCANRHVWFPYRQKVYQSALALISHLDLEDLGVTIWDFAVVNRQLVLTTLSVMITCLTLFLQIGDSNAACAGLSPGGANASEF